MNEEEYLTRLEDDEADRLAALLRRERYHVTTPDTANDTPIDQAVRVCQQISEASHREVG